MKSIVILASGRGSNAARIIEHFEDIASIEVKALVSDRRASGALELAERAGIDTYYVPISAIEGGE